MAFGMEFGSVLHLFRKQAGDADPRPAACLRFSTAGIEHGKPYSPLRQVLLTSASDIAQTGYLPGALHENVVLDFPRLQDLVSGSVIAVGDALIRLTFHCEPCSKVAKSSSLKPLLHRRGVLGAFLNAGEIRTGDRVALTERREEYISYDAKERIAWFLSRRQMPIRAAQLLFEVGLPAGYARALPAILRKLPERSGDLVTFASKQHARVANPN